MECDDEKEECFPTALLDDEVWSEVPIPERLLCIHMAPGKSEASYTPQTTAYPQEPLPKAVTWEEALDNLLSNMPDIIANPAEALVQEYFLRSWV